MKKLFVMGANPAWQKTLVFPELLPGEVNRAESVELYAGGKGVNFCRAAKCFGTCDTRLFQFSGGANGALHENALRTEGIDFCSIRVADETRCCSTCLSRRDGEMTELIEPSATVSPADAERMARELASSLAEASGVALVGSLPGKTDTALYFAAAKPVVEQGLPLLVDAVAGIAPLLEKLRRLTLKINMSELFRLTGENERSAALAAGAVRWPETTLAVTDGGNDAWLVSGGVRYRFSLPSIRVVSPLGSGDTCDAVYMSELLNGKNEVESFASGLAAASANCLTPRAGEFSLSDCARLRPTVTECSR